MWITWSLHARNRERKSSLIPLRYTLRHLLGDSLETRMDKGLELSTPLRQTLRGIRLDERNFLLWCVHVLGWREPQTKLALCLIGGAAPQKSLTLHVIDAPPQSPIGRPRTAFAALWLWWCHQLHETGVRAVKLACFKHAMRVNERVQVEGVAVAQNVQQDVQHLG